VSLTPPSTAVPTFLPPREIVEACAGLPPEAAAEVRAVWRDKAQLTILRRALADGERAGSLEGRLRAHVTGIHQLGFPAAAIVLVSASGAAEFVVAADGTEDLVERVLPHARPTTWEDPFDPAVPAVSILLAAQGPRPLARLLVTLPEGAVPTEVLPTMRVLTDQIVRAISETRALESAERRSARLLRLQEVGERLTRTLDQAEVLRELVRQILRILPCRGVVVAHPDPVAGTVSIGIQWEGGQERPREPGPLHPGILADVARSGQAVRIATVGPDVGAHEALRDLVGGDASGVGSALAVPMRSGTTLLGVIGVYASARQAFNQDDEEVLGTIADQAAIAMVNAQSYADSQRERRQSEALSEVARAVSGSLKLHEVLRLIQRHAMALLRANGATVMLRKDEYLHVVSAVGAGDVLSGMFLPVTGSMSGRAVRTGQPVISNDVSTDPESYVPMRDLASIERTIITPLFTADHAVGALAVLDRDQPFTEQDARVLQRLADQVAVAIVNARLFEELSGATRELAVTFDAIAAGLVVVDEDGHITRANPRAVELLGAPDAAALQGAAFHTQLMGDTARSALHPLDRTLVERIAHRSTVVHPTDGLVYDLVVSPHPEGGAVIFFDDVTSFHVLADRYRDLLERASDAVYTLDPDGFVTSANAATAQLVGAERDAVIGTRFATVVDPADEHVLRAEFAAACEGESRRFECHVVRRDGERRLLSVSNTPIRQADAIVGVLGIARDVTDERASASALARAEASYTRLVEAAVDAIFTVDEEGHFTAVNPALEAAVGRARDTLLTRHFTEIVMEDDRSAMWEVFVRTLHGERVRRELRYLRADGTDAIGVVTTAPIAEGDRVIGVLGIMRDVTEERSLMAELIRQERLAALGQLVGGVAHELNNPLTGISAHAQLLAEWVPPGSEQEEAARVIIAESSRAARIVRKLLAFVRQGDTDRIPVDVNAVVRDTIELRAYLLRVQQIDLVTELEEGLPAILGDPAPLQQVLVNLLTNAEHAVMTGERERRVTVATESDDTHVRVLVRDSGPGIPADRLDRIFNPFFTTKPRGLGTGLGLPISDGIVREHGGRLLVRSSESEGSTFIIELPIHRPPVS
jgi:PAS domain S-box-containing protein